MPTEIIIEAVKTINRFSEEKLNGAIKASYTYSSVDSFTIVNRDEGFVQIVELKGSGISLDMLQAAIKMVKDFAS